MKKVLFAAGFAAVICLTGCNALYEKFGTTPEELHDLAVEKVTDYAEDAINKKIEKSENLSDAGKAKLKSEVAKLKAEIIAKLAEIKAKMEKPEAANPDTAAAPAK